jgi:hypothetical protein
MIFIRVSLGRRFCLILDKLRLILSSSFKPPPNMQTWQFEPRSSCFRIVLTT